MKNYYKERFELQRRVARVLAPALEVNEILENLRKEARAVVATAMEACVLLLDTEPGYGTLRWTVDTPQDLELVRQIYVNFGGRIDFSWQDMLDLFARQPELAQINASVPAKHVREIDKRV